MDVNIKERYRKLADKIIKGLQSRNMQGYYAETKEEALALALELIPEGSSISWGGATSAHEIGLTEAVINGNYVVYNRDAVDDFEEKRKISIQAMDCDFFLASTNAITEDGILVNIDGMSNRVAAIAFGPRNVLMIVGMNKVARDVDAAVSRARNIAAPINAQRFPIETPCKVTGSCANCKSISSICCQFLITRFSREKDRIKVILVNDNLGF